MENTPFIARLDTKVQVYRFVTALDDANQRVETPELVCETLAAVTDNRGGESVDNKVEHNTSAVYTIRVRPGLLAKQKLHLHDGDTVFNITHVRKLKRTHLVLTCEAYE